MNEVANKNQRDPNLRAATVARVNELVKGGLTKAGAFEKISTETGRAKDAVQMLYYRAMRAAKAGSKKPAAKTARRARAGAAAAKARTPVATRKAASRSRRRSRPASRRAARPRPQGQSTALGSDFPVLLSGIASAINALLKHVEKTVEENKTLREQGERLKAITSLIRGR
jgi:hypothetical protein